MCVEKQCRLSACNRNTISINNFHSTLHMWMEEEEEKQQHLQTEQVSGGGGGRTSQQETVKRQSYWGNQPE